jgi:GNAT superfamily N-acetyltransferase
VNYTTRNVGEHDIELITRHREAMFAASGKHAAETLRNMSAHFPDCLAPKPADDSYFGWVVEENGNPVASLGMIVIDWPPHPAHPAQAQRDYILNVFVEPAHRRKGLARQLMALADQAAKDRGLEYVVLHATAQGRQMYEKLGWAQTSEMALPTHRPEYIPPRRAR